MNEIMQLLQTTFGPLVLIFTVSNLFAMGLQVRMPDVMGALKNTKAIALIFIWGWIAGPIVGYLIVWVLPLAEPYVVVILPLQFGTDRSFPAADGRKSQGRYAFCGNFSTACGLRYRNLYAIAGSDDD